MKYLPCVWKLAAALVIVVVLALLAGCAGPSATSSTPVIKPSPTLTITPTSTSSGPAVQITSPAASDKFGIGSITIVVKVANFTLADKLGQANTQGEGHVNYFMDVDPPTAANQPATTAPGTYGSAANNSYTWNNVGSGEHKFSVELVNNDNTPLSPPVTSTISMLVIPEIGPPLAVILSPRDGAVVDGSQVTVTAQVTNFNLVDKIGQPNSPREGHLMYYLDVAAPTLQGPPATTAPGTFAATPNTSYTWQNLTSGNHTFYIALVNNDNTPLNPPVTARISLTIKGGVASSPAASATASPTP